MKFHLRLLKLRPKQRTLLMPPFSYQSLFFALLTLWAGGCCVCAEEVLGGLSIEREHRKWGKAGKRITILNDFVLPEEDVNLVVSTVSKIRRWLQWEPIFPKPVVDHGGEEDQGGHQHHGEDGPAIPAVCQTKPNMKNLMNFVILLDDVIKEPSPFWRKRLRDYCETYVMEMYSTVECGLIGWRRTKRELPPPDEDDLHDGLTLKKTLLSSAQQHPPPASSRGTGTAGRSVASRSAASATVSAAAASVSGATDDTLNQEDALPQPLGLTLARPVKIDPDTLELYVKVAASDDSFSGYYFGESTLFALERIQFRHHEMEDTSHHARSPLFARAHHPLGYHASPYSPTRKQDIDVDKLESVKRVWRPLDHGEGGDVVKRRGGLRSDPELINYSAVEGWEARERRGDGGRGERCLGVVMRLGRWRKTLPQPQTCGP